VHVAKDAAPIVDSDEQADGLRLVAAETGDCDDVIAPGGVDRRGGFPRIFSS
jgi:hypothetical protein